MLAGILEGMAWDASGGIVTLQAGLEETGPRLSVSSVEVMMTVFEICKFSSKYKTGIFRQSQARCDLSAVNKSCSIETFQ